MLTFLLHVKKYFILHQMECLGMLYLTPNWFFFRLARKHQYSCCRLTQGCPSQQQIKLSVTEVWFCWSILCAHPHQCHNFHNSQSFGKEHENQHTFSDAFSSSPLLWWRTWWARGLHPCFYWTLTNFLPFSNGKFSNNFLNLFWPSQFPVALGSTVYGCEGGKSIFFLF